MKKVRLQFEIPEDRLEVLDDLMREAGMKTRTELFNNAMTLLRWAIKQRKEGRAIASIDFEGSGFRELEMPIFENLGEVRRVKKSKASTANSDDES